MGAELTRVTEACWRPGYVPGRGLAQQFFSWGPSSGRTITNRKVGLWSWVGWCSTARKWDMATFRPSPLRALGYKGQ